MVNRVQWQRVMTRKVLSAQAEPVNAQPTISLMAPLASTYSVMALIVKTHHMTVHVIHLNTLFVILLPNSACNFFVILFFVFKIDLILKIS